MEHGGFAGPVLRPGLVLGAILCQNFAPETPKAARAIGAKHAEIPVIFAWRAIGGRFCVDAKTSFLTPAKQPKARNDIVFTVCYILM
jgi:hypothetical protein